MDCPFRLIHLLSRLVVQGLPLLHAINDVGLEVSGGGAPAAILFLSLVILRLDDEGTFGLFVLTSHIRRGHAREGVACIGFPLLQKLVDSAHVCSEGGAHVICLFIAQVS